MGQSLWQKLSYSALYTLYINYYLQILLEIPQTYRHTYKKVSTVQLPGMLLIEKYLPMRYFLLISVYTAK